jgi:threonyl-tRNA synthetase
MSTTIAIRLPDGAIKQMPKGSTPFEVAQSISEGLARAVISASYNGNTIEATTPLQEDGELVLFSWNNDQGKKAFWHSSAHLLAQALEQMYPGIKLTIGPAIDSGFYYDIDLGEHSISEKDLPAIEKRMIELARGKHAFALRSISKSEALAFYKAAGNEYKTELIENLDDGTITFCDHDDFTDLCRGGHIPNTGIIKAVKLTNIAGAYWRGDEKK